MNSKRPVLLLEDDEVDAMSIERAFEDLKIANRLEIARDGEEGLRYLTDQTKEKPCLILLDLRMPKMGGVEFLKIIKRDKFLKMIPVVVMTTSIMEQDKKDAFDLGAAGYMVKPPEYAEFRSIIQTVDSYWTLSEMPPVIKQTGH